MKKLFSFCLLCLLAVSAMAQRAAIMEFKAGVGISQADVDGISGIFTTYFRPAGYTMIERTQIDRVIDEQGFQRSSLTEDQMVRIGEILNVSKIVVGDVNIAMGQYNVDVRVVNVEGGTIAATEGATFAGTSYRETMKSLAQKLAAQIAIGAGPTVRAQPTPSSPTPRTRTQVETVYGYLHVFPNELGVFQSHPNSVIANINNQGMHGYDEWRLPTNEELSLLRANGYLSGTQYMTKENASGMVLLVTIGKSVAEKEAIRAEQARQAEIARQKEAERQAEIARQKEAKRQAELLKYVDLGLPSGTLWKHLDENGEYTYNDAESKYGKKVPSKQQFEELLNKCKWTWTGDGYKVIGPNGNSIFFPAEKCSSSLCAMYWSSTPHGFEDAYSLYFDSRQFWLDDYRDIDESNHVRLVMDGGFVDLGLPSGTFWRNANEGGDYKRYTYEDARDFGNELPTITQFRELVTECAWIWIDDGYKVTGPNGNSITLPAAGYRYCGGDANFVGRGGYYWLSIPGEPGNEWFLLFDPAADAPAVFDNPDRRCYERSVRLVQNL